MRVRRAPGRARTIGIGVAVGVVAVIGLSALGLYLAPRVLPNLGTTVSATDTVETVKADGATARVTVPAGWAAGRAWGDDAELHVRSPDGVFAVTITARAMPAADAFADASEVAPAARERLASGLDLLHVDSPEHDRIIAAVGAPDGASSVVVVASAPADQLQNYRAMLAGLLESIEVDA
jgi:hypothetical protein